MSSTAGSPALQATGLVKRYGDGQVSVEALRGVDLSVADGELLAIMGPSGSGKSTLLHILGALDRPSEGTVELSGRRYDNLDDLIDYGRHVLPLVRQELAHREATGRRGTLQDDHLGALATTSQHPVREGALA